MQQPSKTTKSRLPLNLALKLGASGAAEEEDPHKQFSDDFGGGTSPESAAPVAEAKPEEFDQKAPPQPEPLALVEAKADGPVATISRKNIKEARPKPSQSSAPKSQPQKAWAKKTYRLRSDQYVKLTMLEAKFLADRGERIGASELAREAFDLLFTKYEDLLE